MRLLLALDSRPSNQAALGILDPHTASWERFEIPQLEEPFKRRGFRGAILKEGRLYVLSSAALYIYDADITAGESRFELARTLRRPEWEVGARAAADLHHLVYSSQRGNLLVANSFMDSIDEISLDGDFIQRHYLWDVSPAVAKTALERNPQATDLVHCNHISEQNGKIYVTCGNWNGTRLGKVICFDSGEIVLEDLPFPHDGFVHEGDFYVSASAASEVLIYENAAEMNLLGRSPDHVLPVTIRQPIWENSFQWVRGIHVTDRHIVCGVTQWRNESRKQPQIPPRLIFFDRATKDFVGELFLPIMDEFPSPSIFTLLALPDERDDQFDINLWEQAIPLDSNVSAEDTARHGAHAELAGPHFTLPIERETGIWPGIWTPYADPGVEGQANESIVGVVLPKIDVTNRIGQAWSYVEKGGKEVQPLTVSSTIHVEDQVVFYSGEGWRNTRPASGELPGDQFLNIRLSGQAVEETKLGCDLYVWYDDDKRPHVQEMGQCALLDEAGEYEFWAYLQRPVSGFRLVFRMYQPLPITLSDLRLSLYATLPDQNRLAAQQYESTESDGPFPHFRLLPRWQRQAG